MNLNIIILLFSVLFLTSCSKNEDPTPPAPPNTTTEAPIVTTMSATKITATYCRISFKIEYNSSSSITINDIGLILDTVPNPTNVALNFGNIGQQGQFEYKFTNLIQGKTYYAVAFADYQLGGQGQLYSVKGNQITFNTLSTNNNITTSPSTPINDIDGNIYQTITLGNGQEWMAENLKTKRYNNGDSIVYWLSWYPYPNYGAYDFYNGNEALYSNDYGALYNYYAIADQRKLCPTGWRIPSNYDFDLLIDYAGSKSVAGGKLKSTSNLWLGPNDGATNESGFTAEPSGEKSGGNFYYNGYYTSFYAISDYEQSNIYELHTNHDSVYVHTYNGVNSTGIGNPVRCIKN